MLLLLFFDSDKAIGLPWCNIGHFHCYCYIFFDWEDGNVTIFLTNFMLLWHYFGQFTTIVTIFLDTRSAIVTNVGHFYCYCYFFLTELMVMWLYFWQSLCYCDIILDSLLLTLHISWHKKCYRDTPGTFLVLSLYFFLTEMMVMWLNFWQTLCYCDIILDSLLLTLHISWH